MHGAIAQRCDIAVIQAECRTALIKYVHTLSFKYVAKKRGNIVSLDKNIMT